MDLDRYRRIGEERTHTLEFEPGRLYVKETVRPKYGLKDNLSLPKEGESGVIIATLPPSPVYKCLAGSTILAAYSGGYPFSISGDIRSVPS